MFVPTNTMLAITIFCLYIVHSSLSYDHMHATDDHLLRLLQPDDDSVPIHEFVKVEFSERLHRREASKKGKRIHLRAFGDDINLWLRPKDAILASDDLPVYYGEYSHYRPGNVELTQRKGVMKRVGRLLEDPENLASLVVGNDDFGRKTVNGHIASSGVYIRSLSPRVVNEYLRKRRSIENLDDDFSNSTYHVVFKEAQDHKEHFPLGVTFNETMLRERVARSTHVIPDTLYPELLILVDHSIYRAQGREIYSFLEYLLAFWNGVDLKYRNLESPRVRFHISAIIIAVDPHATSYIADNMLGSDAFNFSVSMDSAKEFFYSLNNTIPLKSYDIAVTMTRLTMGAGKGVNVLGMAWLGSACSIDEDAKTMNAVTILHDGGAFQGVHVAAHELGHIFGLSHDYEQSNDCMFTNGFIMSFTPWYTENSTSLSTCSLADFQRQLDGDYLTCLYNKPISIGRKLPHLMPGKIRDLNEQCIYKGRGLACNIHEVNVCVNFHCLDPDGTCRESGVAALEGTPCGDENNIISNQFCLQNQCVRL